MLGVDISDSMIEIARTFEATAKQGVQYCPSDCIQELRTVPVINALAPFDLVNTSWLWTNASNYEELRAIARNACNLLRKGGQLVGLLHNPFLCRKDYPMYERYGMFDVLPKAPKTSSKTDKF